MLKKVLLGAFLLIVCLSIGLALWVRAVFTQDNVRAALADQLSTALGQPVKVGNIAGTIYPRVTVNLGQVSIGEPARIHVQTLHVGASFRALLSRRIEHARLELSGARVELPLPAFAIGSGSTSGSPGKPPVEIVSIDAIVLRAIEIVSGGRKVIGDVEVVPEGKGLTLHKVALLADNARIDVTGRITDLSGPVGDVAIRAGTLNFDQMLTFANDFATGTGMSSRTSSSPASPSATNRNARPADVPPMNVAVSLEADRATMGMLVLDKLAGTARVTADTMTLEPISFGVFGGRYDGSLVFTLGAVPDFKLNARLANVDMAAATAFASRGTITGRVSGKLNLTGRGMDVTSAMNAARGTARVDIVDGVIKNLGLIRSVVIATSGRADAAGAGGWARDEPFRKLGATLTVAGGSVSTEDLRFESKDLLLAAAGTARLDGSGTNVTGQVQLSDELSKQAGRDLVRYTQEEGRVTLPATITGPADAPHVRIDIAGVAKRAVTNRVNEEAAKALKKGLSGLFKK